MADKKAKRPAWAAEGTYLGWLWEQINSPQSRAGQQFQPNAYYWQSPGYSRTYTPQTPAAVHALPTRPPVAAASSSYYPAAGYMAPQQYSGPPPGTPANIHAIPTGRTYTPAVGGAAGGAFSYGYYPGMYTPPEGGGAGSGGGQQQQAGGAGWYGGHTGAYGQQLGGGWGNANLVYGGPGYYRPSYYGRRSFGLSDLNVDPTTGELTGALNKYGQALGTQAPFYPMGGYMKYSHGGKYTKKKELGYYGWTGQRDEEGNLIGRTKADAWQSRNRWLQTTGMAKLGPQIEDITDRNRKQLKGGGGGKNKQPTSSGNWMNAPLINWRF